MPDLLNSKPRIVVIGVGGAGGNAVNNMIAAGLSGVQFVAANTDTQALAASNTPQRIQLGAGLTDGLGAGSRPEIGEAAAEEAIEEIRTHITGAHMLFIAAGMGGGTGTGAAYVIARAAKELDILTIAVVTKPFQFEGSVRMRNAEAGIAALATYVDTLLIIPNENLFRVATDRTTFAEAFVVADQVLYSGIACLVDLIVEEGLINLDLADVKAVLSGMGGAMLGMGEANGEQRAVLAAEEAVVNPLLDDVTLKGAKSLLLSITGGRDMTLWEVDEAANRVRQEVDPDANIIVGATLDENLGDKIRVAIVASGMPQPGALEPKQELEAPIWSPRATRAAIQPAPDQFGRRLSAAIGERAPQAKPRAGAKGRARERTPASAEAMKLSNGGAPGQAPPRRRSPGSKKRGLDPEQPFARPPDAPDRVAPARAPAVENGAPVGWPEHWANAAGNSAHVTPLHVPPVPVTPSPPLPHLRESLFQRLAGLVGSKRQS